jgi:DNA-binding MarR family transcriptional regulator
MVGLANFSDVNISSASRTVALLKRKGLLTASVAPNSRRRNVELTLEGWEALKNDPLRALTTVVGAMSSADRAILRRLVEGVLLKLNPAAFDASETPRH